MRRLVSLSGILALAIGCSSSSGPGDAPTVTQIVPATAATNVALDQDVLLSFSQALNPGSVTSASVYLRYKGVIAGSTLALENGNRDVRLTPAGTLGNNRTYTVGVTPGVTSAGGGTATAFTSTFTTVSTSASIVDAAGDTFGIDTTIPQADLAGLFASQGEKALTVVISFNTVIAPSNDTSALAVGGYLDIDADQNSSTGFQAASDYFRPASDAGSSGLGDEYLVYLFQNPNGSFTVWDVNDSLGTVMPTYDAHSITFAIPYALIGNDDGNVNLAAVVGLIEPTDIGPSNGHMTLGDPGIPATGAAPALLAARARFPRAWIR